MLSVILYTFVCGIFFADYVISEEMVRPCVRWKVMKLLVI